MLNLSFTYPKMDPQKNNQTLKSSNFLSPLEQIHHLQHQSYIQHPLMLPPKQQIEQEYLRAQRKHNLQQIIGPSQTLAHLIENITFDKKKQSRNRKKGKSDTSSKSSISSYEYDSSSCKSDQSKCWNQQQEKLFEQLLDEYGTDFNFIKQYFPKKSKSQIKNKYKQMSIMKRRAKKKKQGDKVESIKTININKQLSMIEIVKQAKQMNEESESEILK